MERIIGDKSQRYKLGYKLGCGSFGTIHYGTSLKSGEKVAIKLENAKSEFQMLDLEKKIYDKLEGVRGIPKVKWQGKDRLYNVLVMDLLGPSLEDMFHYCGRRFKLRTVLLLAEQMITRIENVHKKGFLHRDIKPDNFAMGMPPRSNLLYLIDFGLAKKFVEPNGAHIPYKDNKSMTGTARYCSVNTHMGIEQSRRDDMEALGYLFVYFLKGSLPWQGLKDCPNKEKHQVIGEKKMSISVKDICSGLPNEFVAYLMYCRSLKFAREPDYENLRKIFRNLFFVSGYHLDEPFEWMKKYVKKVQVKKDVKMFDVKKDLKKDEVEKYLKNVEVEKHLKKVEVEKHLKKVGVDKDLYKVDVQNDLKRVEVEKDLKKVEVKNDLKKVEVKNDLKKVEVKNDLKRVEVKNDTKRVEVEKELKKEK